MSNYRPINLANVVSRILSKVIANKLKLVLPNVISDNQSDFVPKRLITDNTTVAYELLHRIRNKRKGKVGQMAVNKIPRKENKSQRFTVCSAYQVALRLKHPNQAEHSSAHAHGSTWRGLWKLKVPPKVHTFLWRACTGCVPTRENLHKKRISEEERCELCYHHSETTSHVLWECPMARNVWALFKGTIQKSSNETGDFSFCSKCCSRSFALLSWKSGQSWLG